MFTKVVWLALALTLINTPVNADGSDNTEIRFGSVAMNIPAEMHRRLTPLTEYLSAELQRPVTLRLSPNMSTAISKVATGDVELAYLTPVAYIKSHRLGGTQLVVKTVTGNRGSFKLMIVVKDNSPIQTVDDLVGKRFAFGDKAALLQRAVVVGAGMPLEKFSEYKFIGHYDNIARGVINGDFDAGILKEGIAHKWESKGLRILYASPDLPPYNISAASYVDAETLEQVRQAFLKLDRSNPAHAKVIDALEKKYSGFARTSDQEYDVVRQLIKPFE